jgi:hypothetical protein
LRRPLAKAWAEAKLSIYRFLNTTTIVATHAPRKSNTTEPVYAALIRQIRASVKRLVPSNILHVFFRSRALNSSIATLGLVPASCWWVNFGLAESVESIALREFGGM